MTTDIRGALVQWNAAAQFGGHRLGGSRTQTEHAARILPKPPRILGTVRGLFRLDEAIVEPHDLFENPVNIRGWMVGATGIEPVTPTMST
jgi:hypothetical protein